MPETLSVNNEMKWQAQLERLNQYRLDHNGQIPYPRPGQDAAVESIGQWASKQRKLFRAGSLSGTRYDAIKDIPGFLIARQYGTYAAVVPDAAELESVRVAVKDAFDSESRQTLSPEEAFAVVSSTISELQTKSIAS